MKVPANAVTDESVKLAKSFKKTSAMSFVNGILRNFLRQPLQNFQDNIKYAVPSWFYQLLVKQYGIAETKAFLENSLQPPPSSQSNYLTQNVVFEIGKIQDIMKISDTYTLDYSSYLVCEALTENSNSTPHSKSEKIVILDMCAAPGGKTFTISKILGRNAHIFAIEKHKHRAEIMRETTQKLGLSNIEIVNGNSSIIQNLPLADKILCDVPCSGLGVIRRKPEIKFHDLPKELPEIQYKILENSAKFLKKGGELVYSTCTLNKAENEEVVLKFLGEHSDFAPVNFLTEKGEPFNSAMVTILPKYFNSDGFFIAKMTKL
jgi:16S rRNA (cytosine967-C5)-methyltransferase